MKNSKTKSNHGKFKTEDESHEYFMRVVDKAQAKSRKKQLKRERQMKIDKASYNEQLNYLI